MSRAWPWWGVARLAWRHARRGGAAGLSLILAVGVAVAMVASASALGRSFDASVRRSAATQLGPIDQEVVAAGVARSSTLESAVASAHLRFVRATLPLVTLTATVRGRDFVARVAQAQLVEVDFARAEQFGGDPAATGMTGPTPTGDAAVLSADLSDDIAIAPGHRLTVYAYGRSVTFRVARVLPRVGLAGLMPPDGASPTSAGASAAFNVFVPPGTIAALVGAPGAAPSGTGAGRAAPISVVAVADITTSNRTSTSGLSQAEASGLQVAVARFGGEAIAVKQRLLDDSAAQSRRFAALFRAFGLFSVLGAVVLVGVTANVLVKTRLRESLLLGSLGVPRHLVVAAVACEGLVYGLAGSAVGVVVGTGLGEAVVMLARQVYASQTAGGIELTFRADPAAAATAGAAGFLATVVMVVALAVKDSNRPPASVARHRMLSPGRRWAVSAGSAALLIIAAALVSIAHRGLDATGLGVAGVAGGLLIAGAIALAISNHKLLGHRLLSGRGRLAARLGASNLRVGPGQTALVAAMYAFALFTPTVLVVIGHVYATDGGTVAQRLGGGAALEVTSDADHPVPVADVLSLPGVLNVAGAVSVQARLEAPSSPSSPPTSPSSPLSPTVAVTAIGIDTAVIGHGTPPLENPRAGTSDSIYRLIDRDPSRIVVGADLRMDTTAGFALQPLHLGSVIQLSDPATGQTRTLTVAGVASATRWAGAAHVYMARSVVDGLADRQAASGISPNVLFVTTSPGTHNEDVAAIIDGTHLANGAYARSFSTLARDSLSTQTQFLDLAAAYAAAGLLAALAGCGVIMGRRIHDRRLQIATLRALGVKTTTIRRAVRIETAAIVIEGTLAGVVTAVVLAWRLEAAGVLGPGLPFSIPWKPLVVGVVIVAAVSLVATDAPARRAARLAPAQALGSSE